MMKVNFEIAVNKATNALKSINDNLGPTDMIAKESIAKAIGHIKDILPNINN